MAVYSLPVQHLPLLLTSLMLHQRTYVVSDLLGFALLPPPPLHLP